MRLFRFLFMALCAALVLNSLSLHPVQAQNAPQAAYVPGEVLIGWAPDGSIIPANRRSETLTEDRSAPEWQAAAAKLASATGLRVVAAQPEYGTAVLAVPAGSEMVEVDRLRRLSWVAYAEPNYLALAAGGAGAAPIYPTDPSFGEQWNMRRIAAPAAWGLTLGSSTITVALVDSGVDRGHPEFAGRLLPGWDYVNNDSDPSDDYGHGTHVAGILAAAMNNGLGVAGLAPQVKLLPACGRRGRADHQRQPGWVGLEPRHVGRRQLRPGPAAGRGVGGRGDRKLRAGRLSLFRRQPRLLPGRLSWRAGGGFQ
jgi:hypothetical protein